MRKATWIILTALCLASTAAADDFRARLGDAAELCAEGRHEEAVAAHTALAEARDDLDEQFDALSAAARCARLHLRSEARALELCDLFEDETYRLGCRAVVYQWASSAERVIEDLGDADMLLWPEGLAATGFMVRAQAHYRLGNGQEAVDDFVRAYQFSTGRPKWGALQRLGDTFRHLMDDEILAEACYRKALSSGGMAWSGLQARVSLGDMLIEQERYDDALRVFDVRPDGSWRVRMLLGTARVHQATGARDEAVAALEDALQTPGIQASQREEAENMLEELKGGE